MFIWVLVSLKGAAGWCILPRPGHKYKIGMCLPTALTSSFSGIQKTVLLEGIILLN